MWHKCILRHGSTFSALVYEDRLDMAVPWGALIHSKQKRTSVALDIDRTIFRSLQMEIFVGFSFAFFFVCVCVVFCFFTFSGQLAASPVFSFNQASYHGNQNAEVY